MKKIDLDLIKNIRDEFMKEYEGMSVQEFATYEHCDFIPHLFSELYNTPGVDKEALSDVTLHNLCELDGEYDVIEGRYEERLMLMRNDGKLPLGLTMEQFNVLDLGYYSWIEYGEYDSNKDILDVCYYDAECIEGVKRLFDLPYFKRKFTILKAYLDKKGLIANSEINIDDVEVIRDFNDWLFSKYKEYDCILDADNYMFNESLKQ